MYFLLSGLRPLPIHSTEQAPSPSVVTRFIQALPSFPNPFLYSGLGCAFRCFGRYSSCKVFFVLIESIPVYLRSVLLYSEGICLSTGLAERVGGLTLTEGFNKVRDPRWWAYLPESESSLQSEKLLLNPKSQKRVPAASLIDSLFWPFPISLH